MAFKNWKDTGHHCHIGCKPATHLKCQMGIFGLKIQKAFTHFWKAQMDVWQLQSEVGQGQI